MSRFYIEAYNSMVEYAAHNGKVTGSSPVGLIKNKEYIAQLVEQRPFKPLVLGSSPNILSENFDSSEVERRTENPSVGGSIPSRSIWSIAKG